MAAGFALTNRIDDAASAIAALVAIAPRRRRLPQAAAARRGGGRHRRIIEGGGVAVIAAALAFAVAWNLATWARLRLSVSTLVKSRTFAASDVVLGILAALTVSAVSKGVIACVRGKRRYAIEVGVGLAFVVVAAWACYAVARLAGRSDPVHLRVCVTGNP